MHWNGVVSAGTLIKTCEHTLTEMEICFVLIAYKHVYLLTVLTY